MRRIHLGCGMKKPPDHVNVDSNPKVEPDVCHDLTVYPWPFNDDSADEVVCVHTLEHLITQGNAEEFFAFFRECWRILKAGGKLSVIVPDANSGGAFSDPSHKCAFNKDIFAFISKESISRNATENSRMTVVDIDFDFGVHTLNVVNGDIHMGAVAIK